MARQTPSTTGVESRIAAEASETLKRARPTAAHDKSFREKVEAAIKKADDPATQRIPNATVNAESARRRAAWHKKGAANSTSALDWRQPIKHRLEGVTRCESAETVQQSYAEGLPRLAEIAAHVASLKPRQVHRALAKIDQGSGETAVEILVLMDEVDGAFAAIRRKLAS